MSWEGTKDSSLLPMSPRTPQCHPIFSLVTRQIISDCVRVWESQLNNRCIKAWSKGNRSAPLLFLWNSFLKNSEYFEDLNGWQVFRYPFLNLLDLPPWVSENQFYEIDKNYDVFISWTNASFNKVHWSIDRLIIWVIDWLAVWLSVFSSLGHFHTYFALLFIYCI